MERELRTLDDLNGNVFSFSKFEEHPISEDYDIVVNCSGLGARRLCGDEKVRSNLKIPQHLSLILQLIPSRGQVVRVKAPAVHHFFMDDDDYILLKWVIVSPFKLFYASGPTLSHYLTEPFIIGDNELGETSCCSIFGKLILK